MFDLLTEFAGDKEMMDIFSESAAIESWLRAETALASAQAQLGDIPEAHAVAIAEVSRVENIDRARLWNDSRIVGYPVLPLVRQLDALLTEENRGSLHLGATTQDIMDTGLASQLARATDYLQSLLGALCESLDREAGRHVLTVMAGRTHAMQAVPTTWGAKLAVYLSDFTHHYQRLGAIRAEIATVSLHGAGGTSAAYGDHAALIRELVADQLNLTAFPIPWHVSRVRLAEWGNACTALVASASRLAREVIDLSRTEIGEVTERSGHHRGASSTMPQKANPITSETLVGNAIVAGGLSASLARIVEAGHERAAGEWQAEHFLIPHLAGFAASSLRGAVDLVDGWQIDERRMRDNLGADHGLIMAEAYMIALAPKLGREHAHDIVYAASQRARLQDEPLSIALNHVLREHQLDALDPLDADSYLGDPAAAVAAASSSWLATREKSRHD